MPEFKHRRYDVVLKRVSTSEEILETMSELRKTSTTRMIIDVDLEGINSILEQVKLGTRKSLGLGWGGGGGMGVGMEHPHLSPHRPAYEEQFKGCVPCSLCQKKKAQCHHERRMGHGAGI